NMPIVFMSARDQEFDRIIGLEKGCDEYITKPFNIKEVILRIHNVLKRVYKDDPSLINIDGYAIDEEKRKVLSNNKEIELTTKEYELLLYFIKNKGIAISREQVLSKVWDENYFGSDRVVDDTLRRLRKKMPDLNIKTIYGFGYRLD
ncbi:MAG: response regulator transcription factor, partial [Coprobacillus cateniformis]|nr:response regulator transcription factor [Coprobacillus cateniformis]